MTKTTEKRQDLILTSNGLIHLPSIWRLWTEEVNRIASSNPFKQVKIELENRRKQLTARELKTIGKAFIFARAYSSEYTQDIVNALIGLNEVIIDWKVGTITIKRGDK